MRVNYLSQKHFAIDGLCSMASSMPPVQFSASRRAQLDRKCDDLIDRALSTHDKFHAAASLGDWQRVRRRNAMNVYRPRSADGSEGPRVLLGSGIVPGTLDDALNGVYCDSTESLRICKSLLSDKFVDGAVLRVFEAHDLRAPIVFAGIKWFIMRGFAGTSGLLNDKDMLTYERMGRIVDRNGQYFSYHVLQSIDLPERPANRERGLQRVDISWCYLYRQLSPDWLGVFMLGDMDLGTVIPHSISSFISAERVLSAGNFLRSARAKRFSALMAGSMGVETEKGAPHCVVCLSPPPKMLGFSHKLCMGCRQNVCRKCRQRRHVFRLLLRSAKPATEHFCRLCIDKVTRSSGAKSSAKLDEVHDVLNGSRLGSSRSGDQSKAELSGSKSGFHESMRLDKLAEFTRRCHDSIAMEEETITWNQEELLEISRFLESSSNKSRRREQRRRSGSGHHTASSQGSRRRHWSGDNSSSSATSNGRQESPPAYDGHYDYSDSPTAENLCTDETKYFEEESVESGPWTECLPNERSGKWTVVFDEDRQEYIRIRVPGMDPDLDPLGNSRVKEKPRAVCIDELD